MIVGILWGDQTITQEANISSAVRRFLNAKAQAARGHPSVPKCLVTLNKKTHRWEKYNPDKQQLRFVVQTIQDWYWRRLEGRRDYDE